MPRISSLLTFIPRPMLPPFGGPLRRAAAIRSFLPIKIPALCGPQSALPPDTQTRSKPRSLYFQRFSTGGTSAAISIIVGMLCFLPIATNSSCLIFPIGLLELRNHIIAVLLVIALSISSAVSTSTGTIPVLDKACTYPTLCDF